MVPDSLSQTADTLQSSDPFPSAFYTLGSCYDHSITTVNTCNAIVLLVQIALCHIHEDCLYAYFIM